METFKLISMVDFVINEQENTPYLHYSSSAFSFIKKVNNYAKFLKQPLELWMFVPCDEEGKYLRYPDENSDIKYIEKYTKSEENIIFENVEIHEFGRVTVNNITVANTNIKEVPRKTIESLINLNVTLTQTAIKQIGL